jgi:hypothetical protein
MPCQASPGQHASIFIGRPVREVASPGLLPSGADGTIAVERRHVQLFFQISQRLFHHLSVARILSGLELLHQVSSGENQGLFLAKRVSHFRRKLSLG